MKWFKHQTDAHSDAKLEKVLMRYGAEGYALYWYCLELIAGKVDATNFTFELEHDADLLAYRLRIDSKRVEEMMHFMCNLGLFENSGGRITCLKLAQQLDERWTRSAELKAVIRQTSEDSLKTVCRQSEGRLVSVATRTEQNRTEESVVATAVAPVPQRKRFIAPTVEEVEAHCRRTGQRIDAQSFVDFYASKGWVVGKSPMKSWEAAVSTWARRDQASPSPTVSSPITRGVWK